MSRQEENSVVNMTSGTFLEQGLNVIRAPGYVLKQGRII
jgi:hypothetical protein